MRHNLFRGLAFPKQGHNTDQEINSADKTRQKHGQDKTKIRQEDNTRQGKTRQNKSRHDKARQENHKVR
jgi:hypothetical protein